jgi:putative FmdB family regulatory protein
LAASGAACLLRYAGAFMPIYEYRCPNGHLLEVFHGMNDPSPTRCEVCAATPLERVLHPVAVHYKGSGFYSTDYGRGSSKSGAKDGGSSESGSGSGSGSGGSDGSGASAPASSEGSKKSASNDG